MHICSPVFLSVQNAKEENGRPQKGGKTNRTAKGNRDNTESHRVLRFS